LILFENVGFRYGRGPDVLQNLSFEVPDGEFRFITGASGAGKSSLLRLLYLDDLPSAGRISLFGRDIATLTRDEIAWFRRRIGVVFQDFRLLDHLTAAENVALPLRVAGAREAEYRDNVTEMLQWVGLGEHMNIRPPQLSGGEKQRVAIARAVVASPDIILADEPTGSVDPDMAERIMQLFMEMNRLGKTIVFATHDMDLVKRSDMESINLSAGTMNNGMAA
jgi:cell division transport system ATP-binding protein